MEILIPLVLIVAAIFIIRLFGAWMLRINEIIDTQKGILKGQTEIVKELKKMNQDSNSKRQVNV